MVALNKQFRQMTVQTCNVEHWPSRQECGVEAHWKHPRWPEGCYCDEHKAVLETAFPDNWERI
jgi:hypothetical protein